jgi:hypothetical protein
MEAYLAKRAQVLAMEQAQTMKRLAVAKAANLATRKVNAGINSMVQGHIGNNAQSRALANALKRHIATKIKMAASAAA